MDFKVDTYMYQQVFILLVLLCSSRSQAASIGLTPEGTQCACVGDRLIYNCSVVGGTTTIWRGTAFDCPLDGSEITLRHSQFASDQGFGICNNGDIVGRGILVVNNCFLSQLNVIVRESFTNKTVKCVLNSNEGIQIIGESLLNVVSATNLYPPPDNLILADAQPGKLIFSWTGASCSGLMYNITSDCGTCPSVTNATTATCTDLQLMPNAALCHFRISSHACDLVGNPSSPLDVILKVPNIPQLEVIPVYSNDSQPLKKLLIVMTVNQTEDYFYINGNISGSPRSFTAYASTFDSTVSWSSCEEGSGCPIELQSLYCSQTTIINVSVSAANKLGEGPRSDPFMIECTNNFVQVVYRETASESTISCVFLNQSDTSEKSCCVANRLCSQKGSNNAQQCNKNTPYDIKLELPGPSNQAYCYNVTARNDTYTVKVEGTFKPGFKHGGSFNTAAAVTIGIIIPCLTLFLLLVIIMVVIKVKRKTRVTEAIPKSKKLPQRETQYDPLKPYLKHISLSHMALEKYDIKEDCACNMQEYITKTLKMEFKRGHAYYEFNNEIENIPDGKAVLLQDRRNNKKWFSLVQSEQLPSDAPKLYGEGIARDNFGGKYKVFIQSLGSGARHLPGGSSILYNDGDQIQLDILPLVSVCQKHLKHMVVKNECTVQQFCAQNKLRQKSFNIFVDLEHLPEGKPWKGESPRDVILMDKESCDHELFTGPLARRILNQFDSKNKKQLQMEKKWMIFVLLRKENQGLVLRKNTEILCQDLMYLNGRYTFIEVDQDCVQMSTFIETKLNCKFECGKTFYEATESEDLEYCKKILRPVMDEHVSTHQEFTLESPIEFFYAIHGVPTKAVKSEHLKLNHRKIFIQSMSQGSRCLKKGARLLYLKEYLRASDIQPKGPIEANYHKDIDDSDSEVDSNVGDKHKPMQ